MGLVLMNQRELHRVGVLAEIRSGHGEVVWMPDIAAHVMQKKRTVSLEQTHLHSHIASPTPDRSQDMPKRHQNVISAVADRATDVIEKVSSPASRAGAAVERAGRMLEEGVSPDVIALQMTNNSPTAKHYTVENVMAYGDLYEDAKTKAPLTAAQTRALINDQRAQREADDAVAGLASLP